MYVLSDMDEPVFCIVDGCASTDLHYVKFVDEKADPERFEKWALACRIDLAKVNTAETDNTYLLKDFF